MLAHVIHVSPNISAISWQTVLVVEEAGVPGENHRHSNSGPPFFLIDRIQFYELEEPGSNSEKW
jgi:hypothetical protein